jgi:ABC-type amino acid transport substrate-binding protein
MRKGLSILAFFILPVLVLTLSGAGPAPSPPAGGLTEVTVYIGEQPPLFSPSGGIVDMAIVKALEAAGYRVRLEWLPIGRMLQLLQQDSLEVFISASNTPGQQHPHVPFLEAKGVFFYKKAAFPSFAPARLEDLAGKRVATVVNSPNTPLFAKAGMLVDEGPIETLFTKLDLGRVDFAATSDVGGILMVNRLFPGRGKEFGFTELSYSAISAGLYAKDNPALLAAARKGLAAIRSDGSLVRMLKDFFGAENWQRVRILD